MTLVIYKQVFKPRVLLLLIYRSDLLRCALMLVHIRRRSNVFGDARFWFLSKPNQILPNLPRFVQISLKFAQIGLNFVQICLKKVARESGCIPS